MLAIESSPHLAKRVLSILPATHSRRAECSDDEVQTWNQGAGHAKGDCVVDKLQKSTSSKY